MLLETIPGVGDLVGLTLASEIGDVARFATPPKLIGYAGLAPRVHQSGQRSHTGALSKAGSRTLRWAAVEAAHAAWRPTNPWHGLYSDIAKRTDKNPAKSAVARKIPDSPAGTSSAANNPSSPPARRPCGATDVSANSRCFLAAGRPRMELRSRDSSHEQTAPPSAQTEMSHPLHHAGNIQPRAPPPIDNRPPIKEKGAAGRAWI